MKTTEKLALVGAAFGVAAGIGVYYLLPGAHWSIPVIAGFLIAGGMYSGLVKQVADERIADGKERS